MTGKVFKKVSQPIQPFQDSDGGAEGILGVPEDLESRLPEFKRRYLEYRKQKGWPDLPIEEPRVGKFGNLELLQAYQAKPTVAVRSHLVQQNIDLVKKVAHQVSRYCAEPYEDLVQVGSIGLIRAVEHFDAGRGKSFSFFAVPYIRGEMQHYLRERSSSVRIPNRFQELARKGHRVSRELEEDLGSPKECEVADALETSVNAWHGSTLPLEVILPSFKDYSFRLAEEDRFRLRQALHELESPYREILDCVFFKDLTQTETARRLGISPMTVSRKLKSALRQLWHILNPST